MHWQRGLSWDLSPSGVGVSSDGAGCGSVWNSGNLELWESEILEIWEFCESRNLETQKAGNLEIAGSENLEIWECRNLGI